jgi:hypothetical protein
LCFLKIKQEINDDWACERGVPYQEQDRNRPAGYRAIVPEDVVVSWSSDLHEKSLGHNAILDNQDVQ